MRSRIQADELLRDIINNDATLYYQPPESVRLEYPCVIYNMQSELNDRADNLKYSLYIGYNVVLIDKNPDSKLFERFITDGRFSFDRKYQTNNLNHWVFMFYY